MRLQNLFIVAASYLFYGMWDWRFLILIAFTSAASYASGRLIEKSSRNQGRWFVATNVIINLLILGIFKYYNFFLLSFSALFHLDATSLVLRWVLPVGISFYTFQALSYSIDVYRQKIKPTHDLVAFFAYVSFFPQLVAGPIERATNLLPQFLTPRKFSYPQAVEGLRQMLWGFFKKMVIADSCALYVDSVFAMPSQYNSSTLAISAILFSIQIYCDFSGYSDIAIGCAKLFGISLRRNFATPYFSRDIAEFWRRWHISLTSWFRDYVYIPLGGSRVSKGRAVTNTFIIFLLSGLWHGANWTFLAWGLYHALLFIPLILLGRNRRYTNIIAEHKSLPSLKETAYILLTFILVTIGWIIFRASSISEAIDYIRLLFCSDFGLPMITSTPDAVMLAIAIGVMLVVEWSNRREEHEFALQPRSIILRWMGYIFLIIFIITRMQTNEMPFIYFQF